MLLSTAAAVQGALLLLCSDQLALHQIHLLLEALDRTFKSQAGCLLSSECHLSRHRRLVQETAQLLQLLHLEVALTQLLLQFSPLLVSHLS